MPLRLRRSHPEQLCRRGVHIPKAYVDFLGFKLNFARCIAGVGASTTIGCGDSGATGTTGATGVGMDSAAGLGGVSFVVGVSAAGLGFFSKT